MPDDSRLPTADDIHGNHDDIVERYDLTHEGVQAYFPDRKLDRVIEAVKAENDVYRRAAVLLQKLVSLHLYEDGNKRTAWVTAEAYLNREGVTVEPDAEIAAKLLKHIRRFSTGEIAEWLRTGEIDRSRFRGED